MMALSGARREQEKRWLDRRLAELASEMVRFRNKAEEIALGGVAAHLDEAFDDVERASVALRKTLDDVESDS